MEARSLFAIVAIIFLLWMIRKWIQWDLHTRRAQKSRELLRNRVASSAFVERVRPAVQVSNAVDHDHDHDHDYDYDSKSLSSADSSRQRSATDSSDTARGDIPHNDKPHNSKLNEEICALESRLRKANIELDQARSQASRNLLNSSRSSSTDVQLQKTIDDLNARLSAQSQELQRHVHAVEHMDKLKKQLFDKHRELERIRQLNERTEETLSQFRSGAQKAAMLEQENTALREHNEQMDSELVRLQQEVRDRDGQKRHLQGQAPVVASDNTAEDTAEPTDVSVISARKDQIRQALDDIKRDAATTGKSDLEIRRLESELESLSPLATDSEGRLADIQRRLRKQRSDIAEVISASAQPARSDTTSAVRSNAGESIAPVQSPLIYAVPDYQDDLKTIKGIGPVMENTLNQLGVTTYLQLATFTQEDIDKVSAAIEAFPGRIQRDDWVGKAARQHEKKYGVPV